MQRILIKLSIVFLLTLSALTSEAQQQPLYTMYMWNPSIINPAYAGSRDALTVSGVWREQWVGLDGAPSTQALSIHSPLPNDNVGLGLTIQNDNIGPTNTTGIWGDFAYRLPLTENSRLAFGLRAGFSIHQADFTSLENINPDDPAFQGNVENYLSPNIGFGLFYSGTRGYVGLSSPTLLETELNGGNNGGNDASDIENRHYYLMAGYVFNLTKDSTGVKFKPSAMVRMVKGAPVSFDITANFLIKEKLWLGASYRSENTFAGLISFQFTPHLQAGYAYDFGTSDLSNYNSGSHELMLTYDFFKSEVKTKSPRYF